jgi:hypothetical protein
VVDEPHLRKRDKRFRVDGKEFRIEDSGVACEV